jgi:cytochrome c-type biogenesis protein CcmH/NrfF
MKSTRNFWAPAPGLELDSRKGLRQRPPSAAATYIKGFAALLALTFLIVIFMGAGDSLDQRFNTVGHKLMCACGCNQVLLECNHVGCSYSDRMRNELSAGLQRGDNDDLILQAFVQKYGPTVLGAPTTTGFNRIAWIMPFAALGGGILLTITIVRAWKHRPATPAVAMPANVNSAALDSIRNRVHQETEL